MRHAKRQELAQKRPPKKESKLKKPVHAIYRGVNTLLFCAVLAFVGYQGLVHPASPLPDAWNPTKPLRVSDPVTPLTTWKLNRTAADGAQCQATLAGHASLTALADRNDSAQCHIRDRVSLQSVGQASLAPLDTRCAIALRMAMWERHSLQPAAATWIGAPVTGIDHIGSYACRALRTAQGPAARMSTHATADAIDIAGFRFANGQRVRLLGGWNGTNAEAGFLRAVRDGSCKWFSVTLSPDYNRLHADHFHLQSTGWGLCR